MREILISSHNRQTGTLGRHGDPVMAAKWSSVVLGLGSDVEEVIGADKDHSDIVKFSMRSDATYQSVRNRIQDVVGEAAAVSSSRLDWTSWRLSLAYIGTWRRTKGGMSWEERKKRRWMGGRNIISKY